MGVSSSAMGSGCTRDQLASATLTGSARAGQGVKSARSLFEQPGSTGITLDVGQDLDAPGKVLRRLVDDFPSATQSCVRASYG